MTFPADMGVSATTVRALRDLGYDAIHLRDQGLSRLEDSGIVAKARAEGRVTLTFDLDFGEILALSREATPSVILFRMKNQTPRAVTSRLLQVIEECAATIASGAFVTVEDHGFRLRRLPIR